MKTKDLVKIALYVALYVALDYVSSNYLPKMPQGGSLGLGTVVLIIASFDLGVFKAMLVVALGLILEFWYGTVYFVDFGQYALDYIIAFMAYALAKGMPKLTFDKKSILYTILPVILVNAFRFVSSTISGILYYGVDLWGSIQYQAMYMLPTLITGIVIVPLLYKALRPYFSERERA